MKPENLNYADFANFDIRVGEILSIEDIPKSKKLVKLQVNFGDVVGVRTILAGIAPICREGENIPGTYIVIGQRVLAVINLAPREMFGFTSHGMLLAGHDADNKIWLSSCHPCPVGTEIG